MNIHPPVQRCCFLPSASVPDWVRRKAIELDEIGGRLESERESHVECEGIECESLVGLPGARVAAPLCLSAW